MMEEASNRLAAVSGDEWSVQILAMLTLGLVGFTVPLHRDVVL